MESELLTFRSVTGITLRGEAWGAPDAPVVVCAHGGGQTRHAWGQTARNLAANGYRGISIDLPGHGDSEWYADGCYSGSRMVSDMREVCLALGGPIAWVGASLGGLLGLGLQARHHLLSCLILVDIAPRMESSGVERVVSFMRGRPDGFESLEEAAEYVAAYLPHRPRPKSHDGLRKNLRQREDGRYVWHWDPRLMAPDMQQERMENNDYEAAARSLRIPSLLVRGQMSDVISEEGARAFLELAPGSEYVDLQGAAHMVAGDVNDVFSATIADFLRRRFQPAECAVGQERT